MRMTMGMVALLCAAMAVGCSKKNASPQMSTNPGVTDISATPPAPLALEAPIAPAPAQPVVLDAPAPTAPSATGGKYTVQKGDTLWKIANTSYGDGKQWQRIASANPGVSPSTLKAGQTITIP